MHGLAVPWGRTLAARAAGDPRALVRFAAEERVLERFADALWLDTRAAELAPQSAAVAAGLGADGARLGDPECAAGELTRAMGLDPGLAEPRLELARLELARGRLEQAEAAIATYLALAPDVLEGRLLAAAVAAGMGERRVALAELETALVLARDAGERTRVAQALLALGARGRAARSARGASASLGDTPSKAELKALAGLLRGAGHGVEASWLEQAASRARGTGSAGLDTVRTPAALRRLT